MVILGLGSNVGDRLSNLRAALTFIKNIPQLRVQQVSPVYISDALLPENAPATWDLPYLNLALRCETELTPNELLAQTKNIEKTIGRTAKKDWGPRLIDIDILAWDDVIQYDDKLHIPHEHLHKRPFALWPLTDVAPHWMHPILKKSALELSAPWGSRFNGEAPLHTKQILQRIDVPQWVGIMNITPDSFSGDGKIFTAEEALQKALHFVNSGAEIIDLGAEATGPTAISIDADLEWQRLEPILIPLLKARSQMLVPPKISIDTRHVTVAKKALAQGVDWINDVSGLDDKKMRDLVAENQCDVVFMHHLGVPVIKNKTLPVNEDPVPLVYQWAEQRLAELTQAGIAKQRLIFDIGIGYGKTPQQSLALIKNISVFRQLGVRLLVGHSRKSFFTQFTEQPAGERDVETLVVSLYLAKQAVDYLRVHDVDLHARGIKVAATIFP